MLVSWSNFPSTDDIYYDLRIDTPTHKPKQQVMDFKGRN